MSPLSHFYAKAATDDLNPSHMSLYLALFQTWSINRCQNPISIYRDDIMQLSKIASPATYHKCIKELHNKGYIKYQPSFNPFKSSQVDILIRKTK
ncbi:hypothetical protein EZL74_08485 [Flavobacterium silvisoli]|uniref:Transcriptional regulator n=1 Tax=Flavobacterium silvisoli TaxID=2529433 RepID=A0A4Q9YZN4_9FLAO|nr:hypothetical protein [Flavobacterium silvisoli]TBX68338.1 hypothetical protein EZL74_08485 [Flavobacterium silvisoli]